MSNLIIQPRAVVHERLLAERSAAAGAVIEADGVRVFSGLHADTLVIVDAKELLGDVCADAGVSAAPLPAELQRDPAWQVRLSRRFSETAAASYGDEAGEPDGDTDPE
jgi:hypothetical protein